MVNRQTTIRAGLQEKRPIIMLAFGADGMAPIRSALEWAPLQAHATEAPVVLCYITQSMASAAFVADWDLWRDMGCTVIPLTLHSQNATSDPSSPPALQFDSSSSTVSTVSNVLSDNDRCDRPVI